MRVMFTSGKAFSPQTSGGVQSSTEQLVKRLKARGHEAVVGSALYGGDLISFMARVKMKLQRNRFARDIYNGYAVYRAWDPVEHSVAMARAFAADVVVVQHNKTVPIARRLQDAGFPVVVYMRNVEFAELAGDLSDLDPGVEFIANSRFTAQRYAERFGIVPHVIPPLVEKERYATETTREQVTFINPLPLKGLDIAVEVARLCPDIPFTFLESWPLPPEPMQDLRSKLTTLPNVTFSPRTADMRSVYARTRILLAPSRWEEAWGRVATEAQMSGIPVVGSTRGGLPEAIGPGGVLLDPDAPASAWADAVRRLWTDRAHYDELSRAARLHADRPDMNPDHQIDMLLAILNRVVGTPVAAGRPIRMSGAGQVA